MKVTITTLNDELFVLQVSEELELENFKAFCEIESGFPASEIILHLNGTPLLDDKKSLKALGVNDGDVIVLIHLVPSGTNLHANDASQGMCQSRNSFLCVHVVFTAPTLKLHCHRHSVITNKGENN